MSALRYTELKKEEIEIIFVTISEELFSLKKETEFFKYPLKSFACKFA
jgi:hypothetical protein